MHTLPPRRSAVTRLVVLLLLAASAALTGSGQLAASAASASAAPSGNVYWVATNGNDGAAGTQAAPWKDLRTAMERLRAGDTLFVKPGTYAPKSGTVTRPRLSPGTATRRITVQAANDQVYIQGQIAIDDPAYWTFDGLNVGGGGRVFQPGGANAQYLMAVRGGVGWTVRNSRICCWGTYGVVHIYGTPRDWTFSHNMVWSNPGRGQQSDTDHLIYVSTDRGSGPGYIERNILAGATNGANIKLGGPAPDTPNAGTAGVSVRRNTFFGAHNNIRLAFEASGSFIEDNIMLNATSSYPQGPASVQPYCLNGRGNATREDLWWGPPTVRHTDPIRGTYCKFSGQWTDLGGHVKRNPRMPVTTNQVYNQTSLTALKPSQFLPADIPSRSYGRFSQMDNVFAGDWNGDGVDTPGGSLGNRVFLTDEATDAGSVSGVVPGAGEAEQVITFGSLGYQYFAGDWDGNGTDEIGAFDPRTSTFFLRLGGTSVRTIAFGSRSVPSFPVVGDWNGDGVDDIGVMEARTKKFHLRTGSSSVTTFQFGSGSTSYRPATGDWNGDGIDEVGLWQPDKRTYHLRGCSTVVCTAPVNSVVMGSGSVAPYYQPVSGAWVPGQRADTVGVVLWTTWSRATENSSTSTYLPNRNFEG